MVITRRLLGEQMHSGDGFPPLRETIVAVAASSSPVCERTCRLTGISETTRHLLILLPRTSKMKVRGDHGRNRVDTISNDEIKSVKISKKKQRMRRDLNSDVSRFLGEKKCNARSLSTTDTNTKSLHIISTSKIQLRAKTPRPIPFYPPLLSLTGPIRLIYSADVSLSMEHSKFNVNAVKVNNNVEKIDSIHATRCPYVRTHNIKDESKEEAKTMMNNKHYFTGNKTERLENI